MIYKPDEEQLQEVLCTGCPLVRVRYYTDEPPEEECPLEFVPDLQWLESQQGIVCRARWQREDG